MLDLPARGRVDLRVAWWGQQDVLIAGEFLDGTPFQRWLRFVHTPPAIIDVTMTESSIAISEARE